MKKLLAIGLILTTPFLLSAQLTESLGQNENSQQELQKQMEVMKQEMQSQIAALRDSIAVLKEKLHAQQKNSGYEFFYSNPLPDPTHNDLGNLDELLRERSYNGLLNLSFPPLSYDYQFMIPQGNYDDLLKLERLRDSECREHKKENHKHEWMKGLPFYHLFK